MQKLFYVRIDIVDLMDFATDPEGENMSLLTFAKELKKEQSKYPQIQRMINEAHCYMRQKKEAGIKSAEKRAAKAKKDKEDAEKAEENKTNGVATEVNGVATEVNGVATEVNGPSTNNRNSSILPTTLSNEEGDIGGKYHGDGRRMWKDEDGEVWDVDTGEMVTPFDEGYQA